MVLAAILLIACRIVAAANATNHWTVTEEGLVRSKFSSPFQLQRPYDLVAFLEQERNVLRLRELQDILLEKKIIIESQWNLLHSGQTYKEPEKDLSCINADVLLSFEDDSLDNVVTDGLTRSGVSLDLVNETLRPDDEASQPDCQQVVGLEFDMHTFDHLPGMANRANLSLKPSQEWLRHSRTLGQFGTRLRQQLEANKTSWLHHNLASIYWRSRGDAVRAVECSRRAVHFAPREFRDISFLSLGYTYHLAERHAEAAIMLHAAADHAPVEPLNHIALGNVYLTLGDSERTIACYENALQTMSSGTRIKKRDVKNRLQTLNCCRELEKYYFSDLYEPLHVVLKEIKEYNELMDEWELLMEMQFREQINSKPAFLSSHPESLDFVINENIKIDIFLQVIHVLRMVESKAKNFIDHLVRTKSEIDAKIELMKSDAKGDRQLKHLYRMFLPMSASSKYEKPFESPAQKTDFDAEQLPTKEQCSRLSFSVNFDKKIPLYLPPENKGHNVLQMLSESIGLSPFQEHELPWFPPVCQTIAYNKKFFPPSLDKYVNAALSPDSKLSESLRRYVPSDRADEAEIGQRIITAFVKGVDPPWVLLTISSLYWRVRSNAKNALDCLNAALATVPSESSDVVLVSVASLLYELGLTDDALRSALEAHRVASTEPVTNFLLALIYADKEDYDAAISHAKQALNSPAEFDERAAELLALLACKKHLLAAAEERAPTCSQADRASRERVVCNADRTECRATTVDCHGSENASPVDEKASLHSELFSKLKTMRDKMGLKDIFIFDDDKAEGGDKDSFQFTIVSGKNDLYRVAVP